MKGIKTYILLRFGSAIVILTVLFSTLFIASFRNMLIEEIDTDLFNMVQIQKELFPADFHDNIFNENSITPEQYYHFVDRNNRLCVKLGLQYLWSVIEIDGNVHFTTATSPDKKVDNYKHAGFFAVHSNPEAFDEAFKLMKPVISEFHNEWGEGRMILNPDMDINGRKFCFGISRSIENVNMQIKQSIYLSVLILLLLLLLILPIVYFIARSISEPIKGITRVADNIAHDKLVEPIAEKQKKWNEILSLNNSIVTMHGKIQNKIKDLQDAKSKLEKNEEILQNQNVILDKKVEEKTKELFVAKEKAEEIQEQFTALFEQIPLSIQIFNKEGLAINANQAWVDLWQSPLDNMVFKYNLFKDKYAEETGWLYYLKKAFEGEVVKLPDMEYNPKLSGNIGRKRTLQVIAFPVFIKEKVENVVLVHQDVTKIKEYERELIMARDKAEESDRLKTEFLNNMSHEIRTPMNGIIGFSQLVDLPDIDNETRSHYNKIIQQSSTQLLNIIDNIIEISKLGTNQVKLFEESININSFLNELFAIFSIQAEEKGIELKLSNALANDNSNVIIDQLKLYKVISNLLENAVKFTTEGEVEFGYNIIKGENKKEELISFFVKDSGIGVEKTKQAMIFEKFSQDITDLSKHYRGLGLGLSIAKQNVELMGGSISLESEKNIGSEFTVNLKYKKG